jgi:hypothetical protein
MQLGASHGVSPTAIRGLLLRRGVPLRTLSEAKRRHSLNECAFDISSPDSLYWMGFIFADGCINQRSGSPALTIRVSEIDGAHVFNLASFLNSSHKILRIHPPRIPRDNFEGVKDGIQLSVRSRRLCDALIHAGWRNKNQSIPARNLCESQDFWRGIIDGDGCISEKSGQPSIELVGGRILLEKFLAFWKQVSPESKISIRQHKSIFRVGTKGRFAEQMINTLYTDAHTSLERKRLKASVWL